MNVREQVSWVHASPSDATEKATTLVTAAVARVRRQEPLEPIRVDACPRALVVGGGVAGLRAALDLAHRGLPVTLVETRDRLGGFVADLPTLFPTGESGPDLVREMVQDVEAHESITVLTNTRVRSASGYVGNFTVEVTPSDGANEETPSDIQEIRAGAVVVATGFTPYEPARRELGFGKMPQVVTLPDLMERLAAATKDRKATRAARRKVRDALKSGTATVPAIADAAGIPTDEVLWHFAAMRKYGELAESGMEGSYPTYRLLEKEGNPR